MIDWLRSLADRPIAEHERRLAFTLAAAVVVLAAAVLVLTRDGTPPTTPRPPAATGPGQVATPPPAAPAQPAPNAPAPPPSPKPAEAPPAAVRAARAFLGGYLAYLYGHASARVILAAASALLHRLERERPRVSPAARQRHPRIAALVAAPGSGGRVVVSATIADGGVARYPITLTLQRRGGRWQVTGVGGD